MRGKALRSSLAELTASSVLIYLMVTVIESKRKGFTMQMHALFNLDRFPINLVTIHFPHQLFSPVKCLSMF